MVFVFVVVEGMMSIIVASEIDGGKIIVKREFLQV